MGNGFCFIYRFLGLIPGYGLRGSKAWALTSKAFKRGLFFFSFLLFGGFWPVFQKKKQFILFFFLFLRFRGGIIQFGGIYRPRFIFCPWVGLFCLLVYSCFGSWFCSLSKQIFFFFQEKAPFVLRVKVLYKVGKTLIFISANFPPTIPPKKPFQ